MFRWFHSRCPVEHISYFAIKLSFQTFQPIIVIYRRGNSVYIYWWSLYRPLSYIFRSLKATAGISNLLKNKRGGLVNARYTHIRGSTKILKLFIHRNWNILMMGDNTQHCVVINALLVEVRPWIYSLKIKTGQPAI